MKSINLGIKNILVFLTATVLVLGLGCFVTYEITSSQADATIRKLASTVTPVRENNPNYKYIYPLLSYNLSGLAPYFEDPVLSNKIKGYVQTQYQNNNAEVIGVYYRNLLNNTWAGTNQDTEFHPGSMMKVIIMLAYYRESQLNPTVMQKPLTYSTDVNQILTKQQFATPTALVVGQSYNTKYLVEKMIEDSDNGAETLLLYNVDDKVLNQVYTDLNLKIPDNTPSYTISPREYSAFLRIMYNSTYLTELNTDEALSIMTKSTYHDGIYAGVPTTIPVAQKYGEYVDTDSSDKNVNSIELHNCGIVYTKSPYELCVMTKGQSDQKTLANIIKDVSSLVYNYVSTRGG